jgi:pyruvate dehydrogenase E1 component beta subunit
VHVPGEEYLIPLGQAKVVREGSQVTIVANLLMVHRSLQAAKALEASGIDVEVVDVRSLVPLDDDTIFGSVRKTGRLIIVEEDNFTGGWGAEVAARVADACVGSLDAPIRRIAAPDTPVPFAPVMENYYIPSVERIVSAVKDVV